MYSLLSYSKDIVLVPAPGRVAPRQRMPLAVRALSLLPALFASPGRALFTAGVALGLVSPRLLRFVALRALSNVLRPFAAQLPARSGEEVILERYFASRVVIRRR